MNLLCRHRHLVVLGSLLLFSCTQEKGTEPTGRDFNLRVNGELPIGHPRAVVVADPHGSVIIDGQGIDSTMFWFLDKWVTAQTESAAGDLFPQIRIDDVVTSDTLYLSVMAPDDPAFSRASLSLTIPTSLPCVIRDVSGSLLVSNMQASFTAETCRALTVTNHTGSCSVTGTDGNVAAEVALPDTGRCSIHMHSGNISLSLPTSTSAAVRLHTGLGTLITSGLTFSGLSQDEHTLTGTLGGGQASIDLDTGNGNIALAGF